MLVEHDEPVETHGKSGHEGDAERDGCDHDRVWKGDPRKKDPQMRRSHVGKDSIRAGWSALCAEYPEAPP